MYIILHVIVDPGDWYLHSLLAQLTACIDSKPTEKPSTFYGKILLRQHLHDNHYVSPYVDDAEDPASIPIYWVSKWVDYSDKYGLGYQLCDTSVGVLFNDSTRLLLGSDQV